MKTAADKSAYQKEYYRKNAAKIKARVRKWWNNAVSTEGFRQKEKNRIAEYYIANPEKKKEANLKARIKYRFGIQVNDYLEMMKNQEGKCAICSCVLEDGIRSMNCSVIDHDHATGKVRAILCRGCNSGLGFFRESSEIFLKAIEYLKKHRDS